MRLSSGRMKKSSASESSPWRDERHAHYPKHADSYVVFDFEQRIIFIGRVHGDRTHAWDDDVVFVVGIAVLFHVHIRIFALFVIIMISRGARTRTLHKPGYLLRYVYPLLSIILSNSSASGIN